MQALQAGEGGQDAPYRGIVSQSSLRPISIRHSQLQTMQMLPVSEELRDGGEQVVVVDTLAMERECEVAEERQAIQVVPELSGGVALQTARQPQRLDLDAMSQDL